MVGHGEIWVNADGLPVRQIIHLEFPPERGASEWVEANITTDFRDWESGVRNQGFALVARRLWENPRQALTDPYSLLSTPYFPTAENLQHFGLALGIILLSLGLAAYLMGWLRFKRNAPKPARSPGRVVGTLLSVAFAGYLAYGLVTAAPLKLLSGFPPPDFYTLAKSDTNCPLGLDCTKDFQEGLARSRETGKPMLLDFTGWACVNCRKMEEQVWSRPDVFERINRDYILVSLYVDDRQALPEDRQFVFRFDNGRTKRIRTVGDLWSTFQTVNFGSVSQPYYVQLTADLQVLNPPMQNTDGVTYRDWLASGIDRFEAIPSFP
jgi:thiol:disulfide interchange protein DsbD